MPKKKNFLGGMQNYNPNTGEYEPSLKGPHGETPSSFKSFKKQQSEFEKSNDKRMGKKNAKVEEWRISEAIDDSSWSVTQNTKVGKYAQEVADKLGIDKEDVLKVMSKETGRELKEDENLAKILFPEDFEEEKESEKIKVGSTVRIAKEFGDNTREFEVVKVEDGLKGITIKEKGRDGITYNVDKSQLEGYKPNNYSESKYGSHLNIPTKEVSEEDLNKEINEIERIAQNYHITTEELKKLHHFLNPNQMGYRIDGWKDKKEETFESINNKRIGK